MTGRVSVRFDDRLLDRLDQLVEAGVYRDRSEAIREATRRVCLEAELLDRAADDPDVDEAAARQLLTAPTSEV